MLPVKHPKIAIIGAGMAGLTAAVRLQQYGQVTVFEKSRGVGGRMASRRTDNFRFDHGAQYFTARSESFRNFLAPFIELGIVRPWTPRVMTLSREDKPYRRDWFEPHYVAVPGMTALAKAMAENLEVRVDHEVQALKQTPQGWQITFRDAGTAGPFDWVIATAPAPQILTWFPADFSGSEALREIRYTPTCSLMLGYSSPLPLRWDAARVKDSPIDWIVQGNSRPGHVGPATLVIHSTGKWALQHEAELPGTVSVLLEMALDALPALNLPVPASKTLHRWRYAELVNASQEPCYLDTGMQLGACGDWAIGARVEAAYESACMLAAQLIPVTGC